MATLYVPDSKRRKKDREELALNAPSGPENRVNIIAQLEDAEGNPAGPQLDLPHDADPKQLEEVLNALLQNEDKVPFAFYAADAEITGTLAEHLRKRDASVESILKIVYQPQALFRVRPVTRCSSAIPGHPVAQPEKDADASIADTAASIAEWPAATTTTDLSSSTEARMNERSLARTCLSSSASLPPAKVSSSESDGEPGHASNDAEEVTRRGGAAAGGDSRVDSGRLSSPGGGGREAPPGAVPTPRRRPPDASQSL